MSIPVSATTILRCVILPLFLAGYAGCSAIQSKRPLADRINRFVGSAERLHPDSSTTVLPNTTIYVRLKKTGGSGYDWKYSISDTSKLRLSGSEVFRSHYEQPRNGAPIETVWKFETLATGTVSLTFLYLRPWLGEKPATRTNTYSIEIRQ